MSTAPHTLSVFDCLKTTPEACAASGNELGYMFHHNIFDSHFLTGTQTVDGVDLIDIQPDYWSGTLFQDLPNSRAWLFDFIHSNQLARTRFGHVYGWAVRPGDIGAVPIPAAAWLFGSALLALAGIRRQR